MNAAYVLSKKNPLRSRPTAPSKARVRAGSRYTSAPNPQRSWAQHSAVVGFAPRVACSWSPKPNAIVPFGPAKPRYFSLSKHPTTDGIDSDRWRKLGHSRSIVSCTYKHLKMRDVLSGHVKFTVTSTGKKCRLRAIDAERRKG